MIFVLKVTVEISHLQLTADAVERMWCGAASAEAARLSFCVSACPQYVLPLRL